MDLSDVVDRRGRADTRDFLGRETHLARDHPGVAGNPPRVAVKIGVARLYPGHELLEQPGALLRAEALNLQSPARIAHRADHVQRAAQTALSAQAVQVAPDHQLAEEDILRAGHDLPHQAAQRGRAQREDDPEREARAGRRYAPGRPRPPDHRDREADHEQRRDQHLSDLPDRRRQPTSPTQHRQPLGRRLQGIQVGALGTPSGPGGSLSRRCQGSDWLWWKY